MQRLFFWLACRGYPARYFDRPPSIQNLPIFTSYIAFNVLTDIGVGLLVAKSSEGLARSVAIILLPPLYFLEAMVLFEIAWHVLRPVQVSLPHRTLQIFAFSLVVAILGGTLLAWHVHSNGTLIYEEIKAPLNLTVSLLRMLILP